MSLCLSLFYLGVPPPILRWYFEDKLVENIIELPSKTDQTAILLPLTNLERKQLNELYTCKAYLNNQSIISIPSLTRSVSIDLNRKYFFTFII